MNLRVYKSGAPSDEYFDVDADWDFEFSVGQDGILRIYKNFTGTAVRPQLVCSYPKGAWNLCVDISLT